PTVHNAIDTRPHGFILSVLTKVARYADASRHATGFVAAIGPHRPAPTRAAARLCHHVTHSESFRRLAGRGRLALPEPPSDGRGRLDQSTNSHHRTQPPRARL